MLCVDDRAHARAADAEIAMRLYLVLRNAA